MTNATRFTPPNARPTQRQVRGFTLIELVCVIAIVGVLLGILLPATQDVREAARRLSCKSNLKQITLAAHQFESSFDRLPPGTLGWDFVPTFTGPEQIDWFLGPGNHWKKYQNTSSLALLLPNLEQGNLYDTLPKITISIAQTYESYLASNPAAPSWIGEIPEAVTAMHTRVPVFECPTDVHVLGEPTSFVVALQPHQIVGPDGEDFGDWFGPAYVEDELMAPTNYLGCSGAHSGGDTTDSELKPYTGVMSCRRKIPLSAVRDGTSHTVMYGENIGQIQEGKSRWKNCWMFGGLARGRSNWPWKATSYDLDRNLLGDCNNSDAAGFGSKHRGIVNFAMCDGSIRSISRDIGWPLLYALTGASDGDIEENLH